MTSDAQKRAIERYHKTRQGKSALAKADRKRRDDPERKAYLAMKARERRAKQKATREQVQGDSEKQDDRA